MLFYGLTLICVGTRIQALPFTGSVSPKHVPLLIAGLQLVLPSVVELSSQLHQPQLSLTWTRGLNLQQPLGYRLGLSPHSLGLRVVGVGHW